MQYVLKKYLYSIIYLYIYIYIIIINVNDDDIFLNSFFCYYYCLIFKPSATSGAYCSIISIL